jgi:pimeloyl-ACP methyl ester carboxylesterase
VIAELGELEILTYDRRGYGRSAAAAPASSLDDHVDDLLAILGDRPATLVGHSFGANVVMATAIRRPDLVRSVGVWELPLPWVEWWPNDAFRETVRNLAATVDTGALGEQFRRNALGEERWAALPAEQRERVRAEGAAYRADMRSILAAPYDIDRLTVPAVVAAGGTTTTGHREAAAILAARLGLEHYEVAEAGHFGPTQHPAEFVELVRRAVRLGWPGRPGH